MCKCGFPNARHVFVRRSNSLTRFAYYFNPSLSTYFKVFLSISTHILETIVCRALQCNEWTHPVSEVPKPTASQEEDLCLGNWSLATRVPLSDQSPLNIQGCASLWNCTGQTFWTILPLSLCFFGSPHNPATDELFFESPRNSRSENTCASCAC